MEYIGSTISLGTKTGVKYKGTLSNIDAAASILTLNNAKITSAPGDPYGYGSAGQTYPELVFKLANVEDMRIVPVEEEEAPDPVPPQGAYGVPPAYGYGYGGYGSPFGGPYQGYPGAPPQGYPGAPVGYPQGYPPYGYPGVPGPAGSPYPPPPESSAAPASETPLSAQPTPLTRDNVERLTRELEDTNLGDWSAGVAEAVPDPPVVETPSVNTPPVPKVAEATPKETEKPLEPIREPKKQEVRKQKQEVKKAALEEEAQNVPAPSGKTQDVIGRSVFEEAPRSGPPRGTPSGRVLKPFDRKVIVPESDFDFQDGINKFEKIAADKEEEPIVYNKSASFFDSLGAVPAESEVQRSTFDREAERQKNLDTFGEATARRGGRGRGRGRGRGFRGRGGGYRGRGFSSGPSGVGL